MIRSPLACAMLAMLAGSTLAEDSGLVSVTISGTGNAHDWDKFINAPEVDGTVTPSKAFYEVTVTGDDGSVLSKSYRHIVTKETQALDGSKGVVPLTFNLGRFKHNSKLTVKLIHDPGMVRYDVSEDAANSALYRATANGVQVDTVEGEYLICIDTVDDACTMEAIITHTYAADPAIMETTHWNTPDCAIAAADAITCNSLNAETFQFFEFVAAADTFISVMSIEVTVPQIEKQPNGNIMYVEKYVVNLDAGIGSVAPIREQMKDGVPDLAPDSDCRNYDLSSTEVKALSGGYRHLEAFDTKMQFVLAAPLQVTEGQTYWVRVRFRDGTTPTANVNGCTGSEVGTLGQDAKDCNEQCTLSGLSANCNKGCEAAHPKYMNDENLCASMVCAESTACYADALKGCTFALDLEQEGSLIWTSNVGTSCANTLAAQIDTYQTEDGGLVFVPSLQGEVADEFTTTVSCVAETTLDDGMCSQYTCDRGKLIGLNGAGQYDGCDFQPSCVQGCLAPALFDHPEVGSLFLVDGVAEITEEGDKVVINCDPNFGDSVGDFVGKGTWMCTKDADNNFIWERQLENGGGDGKCIYVPEVVTVPVPITLDDQDIDNNGNIVPRTTTETSTTTTTTTTTTTLATTVTTAVVKRKTLEFRFNNVNIPEMATDSKFEFKKKVIGLITENSVLTEELDIAFVTFSAYSEAKDEERRQRREGDAPDQVDSIVTVHFVDSAPAVTDAVLASITNAIAASLETYTVSVNTLDGVKSLSEAPVAGTSNLGVAYQDEIQAALENEEAEGNDDYTDDEGGGGTTDVAAKQSLTGGEKFGLAILIIMILGMLAGIVWMVHKMQTHPKYKRQQLYGKSAQEAGTSMPMIDITSEDPFAVRGDSSTAIRSVQAQERQRKTSMLAPSKHPSAFSGPRASQIIVPTQPSMRGGRAPSGQPARNLDGFPRQVSARPRQVSVRQGPVSRTMTDDAELGLDAVAPTVFGATQASIRPTNHGGAISQAKKGGISRDRKATMFNQPDAGSLAPPAQPAGRPVSRVMNLEGFGGGGETEADAASTAAPEATPEHFKNPPLGSVYGAPEEQVEEQSAHAEMVAFMDATAAAAAPAASAPVPVPVPAPEPPAAPVAAATRVGKFQDEDASAEGQTAEQWKRAESLRHDHAAARKGSQHFVTENADFITVDGKMVLKHGLKHANFAKRDSMVQRAESGDPEAIKELEVAAQKERERRASSEALQGNF